MAKCRIQHIKGLKLKDISMWWQQGISIKKRKIGRIYPVGYKHLFIIRYQRSFFHIMEQVHQTRCPLHGHIMSKFQNNRMNWNFFAVFTHRSKMFTRGLLTKRTANILEIPEEWACTNLKQIASWDNYLKNYLFLNIK